MKKLASLFLFTLLITACQPAPNQSANDRIPPPTASQPNQVTPKETISDEVASNVNVDESDQRNELLLEVIKNYDEENDNVTITWDDDYFYIVGNGLPNHDTGTFPNSGNPNSISEQEVDYRVSRKPEYNSQSTPVRTPGISLGGIILEPGTAERDPETGWSIEAFQNLRDLGLDYSNAHVQPTGRYHYHGVPIGQLGELDATQHSALVGFAADGHPMYAVYGYSNPQDSTSAITEFTSSWKLKTGSRTDGPAGSYDGTYTQDFEFVSGSGDLDECNGIITVTPEYPNGTYAYFLTDDFPYISRCLFGNIDNSFNSGGPSVGGPPVQSGQQNQQRRPQRGGPPPGQRP